METLEKQEEREHGHELGTEVVAEHGEGQTRLGDGVPATLEQVLKSEQTHKHTLLITHAK